MRINVPQRYEARGTTSISHYRPQNPRTNTHWVDPSSGISYRWDGVQWEESTIPGTGSVLSISAGGTGSSTASGARTNLGLGTLSTQNADDVNLTGRVRIGKLLSTSSNTTLNSTDTNVLATGGAGGITITLPSSGLTSRELRIIKVDSGAGAVTVQRAGSDTINGAISLSLASQYDSCILIDNGSGQWYRLS